jgi:hypothetical protein
MKIIFEINSVVFGNDEIATLKDAYDYYYKEFQCDGWILDKAKEDVYIEIKIDVNLNLGDLIYYKSHLYKVIQKVYYIDEDKIQYSFDLAD